MKPTLAAIIASALILIQFSISGTRLVFSLPAYALIAAAGLLAAFGKRTAPAASRSCLLATALLLAYVLARGALSPMEYLARTDIYMVLACLTTYGITCIFLNCTPSRVALLCAIFALALAEVLFGIHQFFTKHDWMPFGFVRDTQQRASGSFISPIHFAGFLEAVGPFALALAVWRNGWARWVAAYVAVACYTGVVISGSRGGWLSSIVSLGVFIGLALAATHRVHRAKFPAAVYSCVVGIIILSAVVFTAFSQSDYLSKRMEQLPSAKNLTNDRYDMRLYNWQAALDQWRVAPVLGTGAGTHLYYGRKFRPPFLQPDPEHAHCDYLELLAEYGAVGAVLMTFFLGAHLLAGFRGLKRIIGNCAENPYEFSTPLAIQAGAMCAFVAHLAHAVVDFNMHLPGNAILMAIILGILASNHAAAPKPAETDEPAEQASKLIPGRSTQIATAICALAICIFALPKFRGEYYCEKARVAVRNGRYLEAVELAEKALTYERRNPYIHYHLGQAHRLYAATRPRSLRTPHYERAEAAFRAGIAIFHDEEDLWIRLAQTLAGLGRHREAHEAYRQAIRLDPNLGVLRAHYAKFLRSIGREADADEQAKLARDAAYHNIGTLPEHSRISTPEHADEQPVMPHE